MCIRDSKPDVQYEIEDKFSLEVAFALLREEGLALGLSSGLNVAGAMRVAKDLGPGHTVVTILCDGAARYASKMFNVEFLKERGLPHPPWLVDGGGRRRRGGAERDGRGGISLCCTTRLDQGGVPATRARTFSGPRLQICHGDGALRDCRIAALETVNAFGPASLRWTAVTRAYLWAAR